MAEYLKPKQEYIDRYDRQTIERCRRWLGTTIDTAYIVEEAKKLNVPETEIMRYIIAANEIGMYFYKGERYATKEETIRDWMREDEQRDAFFETARAPKNITCLTCGRLMFVSSKHLNIGFNDKPDRVLFFYECPLKHIPLRVFYDDGEEFKRKKLTCPKCGTIVLEEDEDTDAMFLTIQTCPKCGNVERIEIERTVNKPDPDFEKDRAQFCLSEKEGSEFIRQKYLLKDFSERMDEANEKERNKDLYDKAANLKNSSSLKWNSCLRQSLKRMATSNYSSGIRRSRNTLPFRSSSTTKNPIEMSGQAFTISKQR